MRNKFLAALLTLCMTSSMFSPFVFAEGNTPIEDGTEAVITEESADETAVQEPETVKEDIYVSDGQEIYRESREIAEEPERPDAQEAVNENPQEDGNVQEEISAEQNAGGTELIQLPTPTDLQWGVRIDGIVGDKIENFTFPTSEVPGYIFWKIPGANGNRYRSFVNIYQEGKSQPITGLSGSDVLGSRDLSAFYTGDFDSGKYYFTVQLLGDGEEYSDSEIARSETWEYKKPEAQLETSVTKIEWDWPNLKWECAGDLSNTSEAVEFKIFFSETEDGEPRQFLHGVSKKNQQIYIEDIFLHMYGKGYYYFKVRALSKDITKYRHGAWSELSPAYNLTEVTESVSDSLNNILNSTSSNSAEIRQQVESISRNDLRSAMLADPAVLSSIQQLEQKITDEDGVGVQVNVEDPDIEKNFPSEKVQIIGAKLNNPKADAVNITLQLDQPKKEDLVIPSRYKNTLAIKFSMDIEGLEESADRTLKVPVRITLPVPKNMNPKRLSILHYASDGSFTPYETPSSICTYQKEDGQWYVSFMLDHFSDFVMTEIASVFVTFDPNGGTCGTPSLSVNEASTLPEIPVPTRSGYTFDGWYTPDGTKVDTSTVFTADTTVTARWTSASSDSPMIPISTPITTQTPSVTPGQTVTPTPSGNETPAATPTPTPSGNETPAATLTPTPSGNETPQPKENQDLALRYDSENGNLKRQVGSVLTQKVTGAKTAVTFTSSNPKAAKVDKDSGVITCTGVGKAVITAKAEESSQYKAAQNSVTIVVIPKTAGIKPLKSSKKGSVTIKSNLAAKGNDGYQIQYKHNGKTKKVSVKSKKALTKTLKGLKSGKAFKARIRAYKKADGKTYFGKYSPWKTLKKVR